MPESFDPILRARRRPALVALALWTVFVALAPASGAAQAMKLPQTWTGRAVLPEGVQPGLTADRFEIQVFRLSSDEEVMTLGSALKVGGQRELRDTMFRIPPKGWIRFGKLVATDLNVVRVVDLPDGKRRLRLISDHPLRLYDKSDPPGSDAHPFGWIELVIDASGGGTGVLVAAASVSLSDEGLHLDSAGAPIFTIDEVTSSAPPQPK